MAPGYIRGDKERGLMVITNHNRVGQAMGLLRAGLAPFVE